jgi:photosystem II stability/assembly factor-like uncharacterized protein
MSALKSVVALAGVLSMLAAAPAGAFVDALDTPAVSSALATKSLMQGVARAGTRLVAVGQRGHVVVSDDNGASWKQSRVPVSSDLVAVFFVDERNGWAVGHDGVVLRSSDAGETWTLQLDGRKANELQVAAMQRKVASDPASEEAKRLLAEAQRDAEQGPDKPFLDVWFANAENGFVVGAYNLIVHTTDGGKTWESWFDRTDNPKFFNLYAIRPVAGALFIAGESGTVLKLDRERQRFVALATPYKGSFFGVADAQGAVLVFGLRGNIFRSDDGGAQWTKVDGGLAASVVAATRIASGTTLLADAGGRIIATDDGGRSFRSVSLKQPTPVTGLADAGAGRLALTGPRGVAVTETAGHP